MLANNKDKPLPPGTVLDEKYRIIRPIGEGGMGMVYHVKHLLMRKDLALKRLHPTLSAVTQLVQRFEREAQAAARIDHPNVCLVTDCGRDERGGFYIVMELLQGLSLQEVIDLEGSLPFERIVHLGKQVCAALEQAHGLGVVHRDLKPDNIMLIDRDGDRDFVKIMDFGIAKMVTDDTPGMNLTQAGMVFGTPHYLSPEQGSGDPIDHRSDLYSLGVILFELATGKRPFEASSAASLIRLQVTAEPPTLKEFSPHDAFPSGFQELISRLLAKEPEDRYPSAKVVGDHLSSLGELPTGIPSMTSMAETKPVPVQLGPPPLEPHIDIEEEPSVQVEIETVSTTSVSDIEASAEERLKDWWSGGRWARLTILLGSALLAALVVGGVLALVFRPWAPPDMETETASEEEALLLLEQQRSEFNETPEIKEVLTLSIEGETEEAISFLKELTTGTEHASSPHLYYHLAVLHSNVEMLREATEAVGRCMELEPGYSTEPILLGILVQALHESDTTKYAARVMIKFPSEKLAHRIEPIAREEPDEKLRGKALAILQNGDMMQHLEPWSRLAAELADPDPEIPCETRREILVTLTDLGDPRALPSLALFKETDGCEGKDCWECIRSEWQKAVDKLQAAGE